MTSSSDQNQMPAKTGGALLKFAALSALLLSVLAAATWYQNSLTPQAGVRRHDCDLQQGGCLVTLGDGHIRIEAGPLPLQSLSPLNLKVSLDGIDAKQILADLQGSDMYMGVNQFELQQSSDQHWQGKTELAVCTTGSMLWQLTLEIATPEGPQQHQFEFEAR